jgi:hypothetical protein
LCLVAFIFLAAAELPLGFIFDLSTFTSDAVD